MEPTKQAKELQIVAIKLLQMGYYSFNDYLKFCKANNLLLF